MLLLSNNMKSREPEELLNLTQFLFESNEDLDLCLVGGLAVQEVYGARRVRKTSDIDILAPRKDAEKFVERMRKNGYETFYNPDLDKYSIFKHEEGIHIDIYPGRIGRYELEHIGRVLIKNGIAVASPEDLIGIKLYAYLTAERGNNKHLIDIYTIIIGKEELELERLIREALPYVSKITNVSEMEILERMCRGSENVFSQFTPKERRFIIEECKRILDYFKYIRGVITLSNPYRA